MILAVLLAGLSAPAHAASPAGVVAPEDKLWPRRVIVLLGDRNDREMREQTKILRKGEAQLKERDIDLLAERKANGLLHNRFDHGEGFLFLLLGKDGEEKLRSAKPVALSKITDLVDEMPMRKDEMKEKKERAASKEP